MVTELFKLCHPEEALSRVAVHCIESGQLKWFRLQKHVSTLMWRFPRPIALGGDLEATLVPAGVLLSFFFTKKSLFALFF